MYLAEKTLNAPHNDKISEACVNFHRKGLKIVQSFAKNLAKLLGYITI